MILKCQGCGCDIHVPDGEYEKHHRLALEEYPEIRPDNRAIICPDCHDFLVAVQGPLGPDGMPLKMRSNNRGQ